MTDIGSPVRLYVMVYEIICPLGTAGDDHENKMEKDSITSGAKFSGGLPGAEEIYSIIMLYLYHFMNQLSSLLDWSVTPDTK